MCADCGSELMGEEQFRESEERRIAAERQMTRTDSEGLEVTESEEEGPGSVLLEPEELEEPTEQPERAASGALYQDSMERANENRSSAWILLAMGSIGILAVALGILGVIPLEFSNPYLLYGVLAAISILFVVAGVVSMKNARIFFQKAESENSLRDTMLGWCRENLHARELDEEIGMEGSESEEVIYFKRFECIKAKLNYQFVNLDQGFLEKFIDDHVYDLVYERKEELP